MESHKTSLYREVNTTTEAMLKQFEADHPGSFLCECPDVGCDRRLALTHQEYEGVRLSRAYLVSLECIGDADVLARTERYAVVDFRGGLMEGPGASQPGWSHSESSQRVWSQPALSSRARSLRAAARTAESVAAMPASSTARAAARDACGASSGLAREKLQASAPQLRAAEVQSSSPPALPPAC